MEETRLSFYDLKTLLYLIVSGLRYCAGDSKTSRLWRASSYVDDNNYSINSSSSSWNSDHLTQMHREPADGSEVDAMCLK